MRRLRRITGAIVLVPSTIGIVCCTAGIIGIWMGRQGIAQKVEAIDTRLELGLQRVSAGNQVVQRALQEARADVQRVGKESGNLGLEPEKNRLAAGVLRKLVHQQVGPRISEIGGRLATLSDAAVAVASLLRSFQELPLGQVYTIDLDKLEHATDQASQLSATLQNLEATIGEDDRAPTGPEVVAAATNVDLVLQRCQAIVEDWQSDLDSAGEGLARLEARILRWLMLAAIAVTVLCAWVGVGQMSLFAHAWKWFWSA